MDRDTLRSLLSAGPTRKFDLAALMRKAEARGAPLKAPLFQSRALNRAIFFKKFDSLEIAPEATRPPFQLLVYVPFDPASPCQGGRSFYYDRKSFCALAQDADQSLQLASDEASLTEDCNVLDVLDEAPTFNPFLLHDAFERAGYEVDASFFGVDATHADMVKTRIKARVRPLIASALTDETASLARSLDTFAARIWENRDFERLKPLLSALQLPDEEAADVLHAWCGLTFFEQEMSAIQPELRKFASWLGENQLPREQLNPEAVELISYASRKTRDKFRHSWMHAIETLKSYQTSFEAFVGPKRDAAAFVHFLKHARRHFWTVGGALGKLEQSLSAWRDLIEEQDKTDRLPFERLIAFYNLVNQTR